MNRNAPNLINCTNLPSIFFPPKKKIKKKEEKKIYLSKQRNGGGLSMFFVRILPDQREVWRL